MRTVLALLILGATFQGLGSGGMLCVRAQQIAAQEPAEFPPGHICKPARDVKTNRDHPCSCHRACEGDNAIPTEDPKCAQWCHKAKCGCPIHDCP